MDTITLTHVYGPHDDPTPYTDLKNNVPAPKGCKAWITALKDSVGSKSHVCWIKIQCHSIIGLHNATQQDVEKLRAVVNGWLSLVGLGLDDFKMSRIDYDYNFYLPAKEAEALINTMQYHATKILRMKKWDGFPSVYYENKSRHAQFYSKDKERADKGFVVSPDEVGLCREEVQIYSPRLKYIQKERGIARDWVNWVSPQMERACLTDAEPVFLLGDFYSLGGAVDRIRSSSLTACYKRRLEEALVIIQTGKMDTLKATYSRNTIKTYFAKLKELNVNPLTIPDKEQIDFIANPFWGANGLKVNGGNK